MAKQSLFIRSQNPRSENHPAPEHPERSGKGFVRPELVARALGYTDREQAIANDVLKQFVWRHVAPSEATVSQPSAAQPLEEDASGREGDNRTLDDLEAAS